ncbi:MAG: GntR family transcriptional regulator [Peptoniphilus sp.]|nr:GntR family transcriptional regulator [Peptoniphilus sp.]MDD7362658.1 GntR family transcriptional regulator [Bacillota bacterium]MDY6044943.1 GntR family transcriptional regulator [Peptoniphilus sp.]
MNIIISNHSNTPLYRQIKDQIKRCILTEELKEGDALPSIRKLANELQVSVLTVRRVYNELEEEGFVVSQAGLGTFVSTGNIEWLRDTKRREAEKDLLRAIKTAKSLQITKDELHEMLDILYEEE